MMAEDMIREGPDLLKDRTFPCDQCDKEFDTIQALNGHKMVHVPAPGPCPECGRDDFASATSMARHRAMEHGVRAAKKAAAPAPTPVPTVKPVGRPRAARLDTTTTVDHIFQSVVQTLYPGGQMPTWAVTALVKWRDATQEMLDRLQA
jgi:hypothetical protein